MEDKVALHYPIVSLFRHEYYKGLITNGHYVGWKHLKKVIFEDGSEDADYNLFAYEFDKDGDKYVINSRDNNGNVIDLKKYLPCKVTASQKIANNGLVFQEIMQIKAMRFNSVRHQSFRELVDFLSSFTHDNPPHQKLYWFVALSQILFKANFRVVTPAGFGKDSAVAILGALFGNACSIENPTLAKLEERIRTMKWLAVNEIISIPQSSLEFIETFLLAVGDHKPVYVKHSRATQGGTEEIPIDTISLSLLYNDIDLYPKGKKYFEEKFHNAVCDRFVPLRLHGTLTEDFNKSLMLDTRKTYKENETHYKSIIESLTHYQNHWNEEIKDFTNDIPKKMPNRWRMNIDILLRVVKLYSETQEEFNTWVQLIYDSIDDYSYMLRYATNCQELAAKMSLPQDSIDKTTTVDDIIAYWRGRKSTDEGVHNIEFCGHIKELNTFKEKAEVMAGFSMSKTNNFKDHKFQDFAI